MPDRIKSRSAQAQRPPLFSLEYFLKALDAAIPRER